jgi:hypothetical protein
MELLIFLFMKYSFIKDLNGLEIVIMYIAIRRAHKVHHKHMGKEQGEAAHENAQRH